MQVFADGKIIEGTWNRPNQITGMTLTTLDGQPLKLNPGRTWVELTEGHTTSVLDEAAAGALK